MHPSALSSIPVEELFRACWLATEEATDLDGEILAYIHWTRPNHFGGRQHFHSAIGLLAYRSSESRCYLLGGIGKSSNRAPWDPWVIECGDRGGAAELPRNHVFLTARPDPEELRAFARDWRFWQMDSSEEIVEQYVFNPSIWPLANDG